MTLDMMRAALIAMAANRSDESWLAGSSVIAPFLERVPNDIDIHHLQQKAFDYAIERDTNELAGVGFVVTASKVSSTEHERTFAHAQGNVAVNWVLEAGPPPPLVLDPSLGVRANYAAIVARKIEMYKHDGLIKHREDLHCLLRNVPFVGAELDIAWLRFQLAALGILNANS
ncbi:hypothetical protein QN219_30305 [Sinorhizobium sp. 7-81]|uniref:hypothetical protein n=1 Tax=Sinorhizobium sp. 8-89 TaxID=3049089 RepID=UPI0024C2D12B|nr:hypothetical protein [Sinorhizobium sp. 8-89]MDK1494259.1 hypothetical protein [Sinorhizobium sp. 8-89]